MKNRRSVLLSRPAAPIATDQRGIAAVEFAMILPIMLFLWLGGVEVTGALSLDRRLNNLAASLADLAARSKTMTYAEVDEIFNIAPGALFPYDAAQTSMLLTAVAVDSAGNTNVAWSRAKGSKTAHAVGAPMNAVVPASLRIPNSQIIMSEVYHTYRPAVGYVITGDVNLEDRMFFVPRLVAAVKLCASADPNSCTPK